MGILIYDGECGFCTSSAKWARNRLPATHGIAPSQDLTDAELAGMGLTRADVDRAAWWYVPGERPAEGAEAISKTLIAIGGRTALVGRLMGLPGIRALGGAVYRWIASHRSLVGGWVGRLSGRSRSEA